jgi:starvation-inducible DNA-binding protein
MADAEDKLVDHMKELFANNFVTYVKAHGFHVAVVGHKFYEYHKFYQKIYEFLQDNIDNLAEGIRAIDEVPPFAMNRIMDLSEVEDEKEAPDYVGMSKILYDDIETCIDRARKAYKRAGDVEEFGLQNKLGAYIEQLNKFCWQLDASTQVVFTREEDSVDASGQKQPLHHEEYKPEQY